MPDYNETTVTGTKWQRCKNINIDNPYQQVPSIRFDEETVLNADGTYFYQPCGSLSFPFDATAAAMNVDIVDPLTGVSTGTSMTGEQIYAVLFSLYLDVALQRDLLAVPLTIAIDTQPVNTTVSAGQDATFTVEASGDAGTVFTYSWQEQIGGVWSNMVNSNLATLTLTNVPIESNNRKFRVNVIGTISNVMGSKTTNVLSNVVTLTVN